MRDYGMDSSFMSKSCQPAHKENLKRFFCCTQSFIKYAFRHMVAVKYIEGEDKFTFLTILQSNYVLSKKAIQECK